MDVADNTGNRQCNSNSQLLCRGLALWVDWSAERYLSFLECVDGDVRNWLIDGQPAPSSAYFEFLTGRQREQLDRLIETGPGSFRRRIEQWSGTVVTYGDSAYPDGLHALDRPPAALHVRGNPGLLQRCGIAVVGSRKIGVSAASAARRILEPAAQSGMMIVSGGALGADAVAHRCAVEVSGTTMAVLPSGLANLSPKTNRRLFSDIVAHQGVLVSEYPPDRGVRRYHFRRRNGLMAAISRGVLVLRAAKKSGTMLTVEAATELGRPLAAVPGSPQNPLSRGCHAILRSGGTIIADADDLLDWWTKLGGADVNGDDSEDSDGGEKKSGPLRNRPDCPVLDCALEIVDSQATFSVESLARKTDTSVSKLQSILMRHELAGIIERTPGGDRFRFL